MFLEILGFCIGILYLWWEYKADNKVWIAGVIMPAISLWVYYTKGLYADFGINIYYLVIAAYGYWCWTRKSHAPIEANATQPKADSIISKEDSPVTVDYSKKFEEESKEKKQELPVSRTPLMIWVIIIPASLLLWWMIWWILVTFTDSTVPVADAFTTALSIVGLWMMARKYAEQWLIWLVVDLVCSILYWYKELPFYSLLYGAYTVISWFGYRKWLRLIPQ